MADELFADVIPYAPFDEPESVAVVLADGLINYALSVARKDRLLAIDALKTVLPHVINTMSNLDFTEDDYNRVTGLIEKGEALLRDFELPKAPLRSSSLH
jgi:hypothetical protein